MKYIIKLLCLIISIYSTILFAANPPRNVLIYYHHKNIPIDLLHFYDWIIVDQDNPHIEDINNIFLSKTESKNNCLHKCW